MFMDSVRMIIQTVGQAWSWFFHLLDSMGGKATFIAVFLSIFTINKFIDLVLMQFLYSPTNSGIGQAEARVETIKTRQKLKAKARSGK